MHVNGSLKKLLAHVDGYYACPTGKTRHALQRSAEHSACGLPRKQFTHAVSSPVVDGRYHLVCVRCLGNIGRYVEINSLPVGHAQLVLPPNARFDIRDWRKL